MNCEECDKTSVNFVWDSNRKGKQETHLCKEHLDKRLEHWLCNMCYTNMTYVDEEGEISHRNIFEIRRGNKTLGLETIDTGCDKANIKQEDENVKMQLHLCEKCFLSILNESGKEGKLGKLFWSEDSQKFIY